MPRTRLPSFDPARERAEQSEQDWIFGALSQPGIVSIPLDERLAYLPKGETQFSVFDDFQDCASRSPVNHFEALFTYHYHHGMKAENKKWLEDNGYVVWRDGLAFVEFSDRYIAIKSGTTRAGNSLKAPLETIRKVGLVPKSMLPKIEGTFEQYHDKNAITAAMDGLGAEFLKRFTINYERVYQSHFAEALKDDMIGVAGYAWPIPVGGIYAHVEADPNHAFLLYGLPAYQAYDNYYDFTDDGQQIPGDFTKSLAPNYSFWEYGYRVYISAERTPEELEVQLTVFQTLFAVWVAFVLRRVGKGVFLVSGRDSSSYNSPAPPAAPEPITQPSVPKLDWSTEAAARHSVRLICDEEGLTWSQKNDLDRTVGAESGWQSYYLADVIRNGRIIRRKGDPVKLENKTEENGRVWSTDWGICQINDYYHIGQGKAFPSVQFVLDNPEACIRWMCRKWKAGYAHWWIAYKNGSYRRVPLPKGATLRGVGAYSLTDITMFQNVSMAGTGVYVLLLTFFIQAIGAVFKVQIDVAPGQIEEILLAIAQAVSLVLTLVGQVRRPDLVAGLFRKHDWDE